MNKIITKCILLMAISLLNAGTLLAQWTPVATGTDRLIWHIAFADDNTIYAVGDSALIKSNDAGLSWIDLLPNISSLGTDGRFFNLEFLNRDTGFVFTNNYDKNVLKTIDGGLTWTDVSTNILNSGLLDMQFLDQSTGFATCGYQDDSTLAKTTNGGATWKKIKTPAKCFAPMAVCFLNDRTGFYGENEVYKTTDGGLSWVLTSTPGGWMENNRITEFKFLDSQTGFAITDEWYLYKTTDGGNNWTEVAMPLLHTWGCRGLDFDQGKIGYITGFGIDNLFTSTDKGDSWHIDPTFPTFEFPVCVAISRDHKVIVGTQSGDVVIRQNAPLGLDGLQNLSSLTLSPNPTRGKIVINSPAKFNAIEIINALGQTMNKINTGQANSRYEIDLSSYAKGLYFISISNENYSVRKKVVLN